MAETLQVKLTEKMPVNGILTQKEKELIAVGASIAAGCQPCTAYHFKAARAAGTNEEEIRQAVDDALCVHNSAAKIMARLAEKHLGNVSESDVPCCSEKPLIGELVSISAAFAVNCVTNLETHLPPPGGWARPSVKSKPRWVLPAPSRKSPGRKLKRWSR